MVDWNNDDAPVLGFIRLGVVKVAALLVFVLVAMCILATGVNAEGFENSSVSVSNGSVVVVEGATPELTITPEPTATTSIVIPRRIDQGACVEPGETIDIAGIGWYTGKLLWYGNWYEGYAGAGNNSIEAMYTVRSQELDNFYVDPAYFSTHLGYWYAVESFEDTGKSSGNDRIFKVSIECNTTKDKTEADRQVEAELNISHTLQEMLYETYSLPVKTEEGISLIVSRNTTSTFIAPHNARYWVFGKGSSGKYYDLSEPYDGYITFDKDMTNDLPESTHSVIFVHPGENTITEETYDSAKNALSSPFRTPEDLALAGLDPSVVRDRLIGRIGSSRDDTYTEWRMALQEPKIMVMKFAQEPIGDNKTFAMISGYTNVNDGDVLTVTLDANKVNGVTREKSTWHAQVVNNGGAVAYRTWNATFLIDFGEVFPGPHELTITSENGASATIPLYFRKEIDRHYVPESTINFVDNSPFVPTPTPEVIIKEVPGPVVREIVTVQMTPSPEQVQRAGEGVAAVWIIIGVVILAILAAVAAFALWMRSVYRRAKI